MVAQAFIYYTATQPFYVQIIWNITDMPGAPQIPPKTITLPASSGESFIRVDSEPVTIPDVSPGWYTLKMAVYVNGVRESEDTVRFMIVEGPPTLDEPMILYVWHNHQSPAFLPDGSLYSNWYLIHFYHDDLSLYYQMKDYGYNDMGAYYLHYYLLSKYPNLRVNLHYSPSLLYQLYLSAKNGFKLDGQYYPPSSRLAHAIWDFFNGLRRYNEEGKIDLLTSVYAHTILGYLLEKYNDPFLIRYNLEIGRNITRALLGNTTSMWTPEMAWSNRLAPIFLSEGINITVLDGTDHFYAAEGDRGTIYEPYLFKGPGGEKITIFFRDKDISNYIAFSNGDWGDPEKADSDARALYIMIYQKLLGKRVRNPVITIADDGENWIVMGPSPANGALFLDRIYAYIDKLAQMGIMRSGTFRDAVKYHKPTRTLTSIPWTSWLGGWCKWTCEDRAQILEWKMMDARMAKYLAVKYYMNLTTWRKYKEGLAGNKALNNTVMDLIYAQDSDFWWKEFFQTRYINTWLSQMDRDVGRLLNITIKLGHEPSPGIIGWYNNITLTIGNNNPYEMKNTYVYLDVKGLNSTTTILSIPSRGEAAFKLPVKPSSDTELDVEVKMWNPGTIVSNTSYTGVANVTYYFLETTQNMDLDHGRMLYAEDIAVSVSVIDPMGKYVENKPGPPGTYTFTIAIYTSNGSPVRSDTPITVQLFIDGQQVYTDQTIMPAGRQQIIVEKKIVLGPGTHTYRVIVSYVGDPYPLNNHAEGRMAVESSVASSSGSGWPMADYIVGIGLVAASAAVLLYVILFYGRRKK